MRRIFANAHDGDKPETGLPGVPEVREQLEIRVPEPEPKYDPALILDIPERPKKPEAPEPTVWN